MKKTITKILFTFILMFIFVGGVSAENVKCTCSYKSSETNWIGYEKRIEGVITLQGETCNYSELSDTNKTYVDKYCNGALTVATPLFGLNIAGNPKIEYATNTQIEELPSISTTGIITYPGGTIIDTNTKIITYPNGETETGDYVDVSKGEISADPTEKVQCICSYKSNETNWIGYEKRIEGVITLQGAHCEYNKLTTADKATVDKYCTGNMTGAFGTGDTPELKLATEKKIKELPIISSEGKIIYPGGTVTDIYSKTTTLPSGEVIEGDYILAEDGLMVTGDNTWVDSKYATSNECGTNFNELPNTGNKTCYCIKKGTVNEKAYLDFGRNLTTCDRKSLNNEEKEAVNNMCKDYIYYEHEAFHDKNTYISGRIDATGKMCYPDGRVYYSDGTTVYPNGCKRTNNSDVQICPEGVNPLDGIVSIISPVTCSDISEIIDEVAKIYNVLKIALTVLLVIFTMLDFTKAVASSEDDGTSKAFKKLVTRAIILVIIFLLPVLIQWALDIFKIEGLSDSCIKNL